MTDLSQMSYGDLVAALRKDLQLDATIDVLPGTIAQALANDATPMSEPALKKLLLALGINYGTVTFTFAATATSASQTVSHGFSVAPTAVLLSPSGSNFVDAVVTATGPTSFTANAFTTTNTTISASVAFYWAALK